MTAPAVLAGAVRLTNAAASERTRKRKSKIFDPMIAAE
jgi:hypothetical protein